MSTQFDPRPPDKSTPGTTSEGGSGGGTYAAEAGAPTDIDLLQVIANFQRIAKDYQQRTIQKPLQRAYRAFRNEHAEGSKYLGPAWRGRSRLFVPKTRSAVRKNAAGIAASLFSTEDVVHVTATDPGDPFQAALAATIKGVLDYRLSQSSQTFGLPWFTICMGGAIDAQITGVTLSKQYWERIEVPSATEFEDVLVPAMNEETGEPIIDENGQPVYVPARVPKLKIVRDRPMVELFPIENALIDPAAPWWSPVQHGRVFAMRIPMGLSDAKAMLAAGEEEGWLPVDDEILLKGRLDEERAGARRVREGGSDRFEDGKAPGEPLDIVWLQENFVRIAGIDYHFWSVDRYAYISKVRRVEEVYPEQGGERPYVMGVASIEPHNVFPMSPVESWQPLQLELNDVVNLRLDTLKRSIAPLAKVRKGKGVDLTAVQRRGQPDSILLLDDPEKDVILEPTPGPSGQSYTETSIINANFDELAGVFSTSSVQTSRQLNETVGGMRLMAGSANAVSEFDLRVWVETWVEPVLRQLVHLVKYYESNERIVLIAGRKARVLEEYGYQPTVVDFDHADVTLRVNVGVGAADPMQRLAKLRSAFEMLAPMFPIMEKQGVKPKMEEIIDEVMGAAGWKDGRRFFEFGEPPDENSDPEMQKFMLELQLEREKMRADLQELVLTLVSEEKRNAENNQTKLQIAGMQQQGKLLDKAVDVAQAREARAHGDMVRREELANQQQLRAEDQQERRRQEAIRLFTERMRNGSRGGGELRPSSSAQTPAPQQQAMLPQIPDPNMMLMARMMERLEAMQARDSALISVLRDIQQHLTAPSRVLRDAAGRVIGIEKGGQTQAVVRDREGLIEGAVPMQPTA